MRIVQAEVSDVSPTSSADNFIQFPDTEDEATRETMAMVRQVVHRTGTDTDTFCKWLMAQKVEVEGPLSGICHWFTHPEKSLHRPRFHQQHHRVTPEYAGDYEESGLVRRTSLGAHLHHSTSISIIMILATVLFLLIITAFVTCIIRKKRRPQRPDHHHVQHPITVSSIVLRKDKPPDYNSVLKMKQEEEEELPSYSQAVLVNECFVGDDDISEAAGDDARPSDAGDDNIKHEE